MTITCSPPARIGNLRRSLRAAALAAVCVALLLLEGCSALRLGYNQADWLAYRWLDNYADFDAAQKDRVKEAIATWFEWHRRTQLPDYASLLLRIESEIAADTSAERVCSLWGEMRARLERSAHHAAPALADMALLLKPAQVDNIERRYLKTNAEFIDDFLQTDPARRANEAVKRVVDRAESVYYDLDPFQRERIERLVADSPYDPNMAFDERRRRQQDALQLLRRFVSEAVERPTAQAQIRAWMARIERSPREPYRLHSERLIRANCRLAADIHNITSPTQRRIASKKLKGWAADLRALAVEAGDTATR